MPPQGRGGPGRWPSEAGDAAAIQLTAATPRRRRQRQLRHFLSPRGFAELQPRALGRRRQPHTRSPQRFGTPPGAFQRSGPRVSRLTLAPGAPSPGRATLNGRGEVRGEGRPRGQGGAPEAGARPARSRRGPRHRDQRGLRGAGGDTAGRARPGSGWRRVPHPPSLGAALTVSDGDSNRGSGRRHLTPATRKPFCGRLPGRAVSASLPPQAPPLQPEGARLREGDVTSQAGGEGLPQACCLPASSARRQRQPSGL